MSQFGCEIDYRVALQTAIKACRLGREVLLHYFGKLSQVEEKFQAGLVSEADRESERVIWSHLKQHYPHSEFLGEESSFEQGWDANSVGGVGGRWILDPLDGTTNYVHGYNVFCISLALEVDGDLKLGVVDVPLLGETFTAMKGHGAFRNGRRISVSRTAELNKALLATGFFADEGLEDQLKIFSRLVRRTRGIRRPGAAAYDLCMVAAGVFDAFWESNLKPWDSAAGVVLVREAGGQVLDYKGETYTPYKKTLVASNPLLAPALLTELRSSLSSQ
ncbi:MAG: inositol monophosphatase [Bdellovibrionaceae bacterium]|nr:inositol monophosphatase [Pseudobdellovibrionaceae bacterium]